MGPMEVLWDGDEYPLERTWSQWKYYGMEMGVPPPCEQTSDAEGN